MGCPQGTGRQSFMHHLLGCHQRQRNAGEQFGNQRLHGLIKPVGCDHPVDDTYFQRPLGDHTSAGQGDFHRLFHRQLPRQPVQAASGG